MLNSQQQVAHHAGPRVGFGHLERRTPIQADIGLAHPLDGRVLPAKRLRSQGDEANVADDTLCLRRAELGALISVAGVRAPGTPDQLRGLCVR